MKPMLSFPREGEALDRKPPKESASPQTHVNSKTKMKHTSRPGCTKWTTKNCHIMGTTQEKQVEKDDVIVGTVTLEVYLICKAWKIMKMRLTAKPHKVFQRLASNESNIAKENNHVKVLCEGVHNIYIYIFIYFPYYIIYQYTVHTVHQYTILRSDVSQNGEKCWAAPKSWRAPWSHRWNDLVTVSTLWVYDVILYIRLIVWKFYIQHSNHSTMNMINVYIL